MRRTESRSNDDVAAFLRQVRSFTSRTAVELQEFSTNWNAATHRVSSLRSNDPEGGGVNLIDEMRARDEELKAVAEELTEQVDTLQRSCALLERERAKYVALFEEAPDAYVVTTLGGTVHEANVAARALFGVERGFLAGRPLIGFVARQDTRAFREFLHQSQAPGAPRTAVPAALTLRMRPRGQPVFVVTARVAIVRSSAGQPVALRWLFRRFYRREAPAGSTLADGELARLLAEDLGGHLAPILEWSHALSEGNAGGEPERQQALRWIAEHAQAQRRMLDDLTELAQLSNPVQGGIDTVNLAGCVAATIAELGPPRFVLKEREADGAFVRGHAARIRRALELLLRRALDGTPQQAGPVRVEVGGRREFMAVDVEAPEGAGIPRGWTLRSAIAAWIVEAHGGELVLHDAGPSARILLQRIQS